MTHQQTLRNQATFSGIGLHSGKTITLTIRPADPGTGIVFHRVDLSPAVSIEACAANVVNTKLCTALGKNGATIGTVEHLMAALCACGVDNAHIDIDGPEVPIMDGSALPFVREIARAGVKSSSRARKYLVVKKPVTVVEGDKRVSIAPSRGYKISFDMQFDHPAIGSQSKTFTYSAEEFEKSIASARTFGFVAEIEYLQANGLARGASLDNAVGIGAEGIMNPEGLRTPDELVAHKILDSVGDLYLAGYRLIGHVKALKSGHDLNHKLVTELLKRTDCYELVEFAVPAGAAPFNLALPELAWLEVA